MFKLPKHNDRGFSLIELAVVVAIIGILAAIAIPTFLGQREAAQDRQSHSALRNAVTTARAAAAATDTSEYPGTDNGTLATALGENEPSLTFVAGDSAVDAPTADHGDSLDADTVSVNYVSGDVAILASQSPSGTCWFVESDLQDGTSYGADEDPVAGDCDADQLADNDAAGDSFGDATAIDVTP